MMKCYFCDKEINQRYRLMKNKETDEVVLGCRSCERLENKLREKNLPLIHKETKKCYDDFYFVGFRDVKKKKDSSY